MSFRKQPTFRITKSNKVVKAIAEHYLRDDIACGCSQCEEAPPIDASLGMVLVVDTSILLHQMDWVSHSKTKNLVLAQTVMQELRTQSNFQYHRIREHLQDARKHFYMFSNEHHRRTYIEKQEGETEEIRSERAVRKAAQWYVEHLRGICDVLFLTNSREKKQIAILEGIPCKTLHEYVLSLNDVEQIDSLAGDGEGDDQADLRDSEIPTGSRIYFPQYLSDDDIKKGMKEKTLFEGVLRLNPNNYLEATVSNEFFDNDILLADVISRNRAMAGDVVIVRLLPESKWRTPSDVFVDIDRPDAEKVILEQQEAHRASADSGEKPLPTGEVVGITRRTSFRKYCGSLDEKDPSLFDPMDLRIPKVHLKSQRSQEFVGKKIVIAVDSWPRTSQHPIGHFVRALGDVGNVAVETEALLIQHGISYEPFSPAVNACLPVNWAITEDDLLRRKDLRDRRIFSIDPPTCTDIDDALHIMVLPDGNFELGVHIADVSHFVQEGTALDREARKRGVTVYMVEKRIDMLPELLGTDLCSLNEKKDRFAFSVMWKITPDGNILSTDFHKSIIRSVCKHSYQMAQDKIDDASRNDVITQDLRNLNNLAKILRKRRIEAGALTLSSPQVTFKRAEENEDPIDVELYQIKDTNQLVEEYMLLANVAVAKQIYKFFPAFALLRRHPPPKMKQFRSLVELVGKMGVELNIETSKSLADSLDKASKKDDAYFNQLVRILSTRCMTPAIYFSSGSLPQSEFYHYGLAAPIYTHFTSPIRRYADVVVHRLLAASIGAAPLPSQITHRNVQDICSMINRRHRMADIAGMDSTRLHTLIFFKGKRLVEEARVLSVKANGFMVLVPRFGIEGKVYVSTPEQPQLWRYDATDQSITKPDGKVRIQVFDKVKVLITLDESAKHAPKVAYACVEPQLSSSSASSDDAMKVDKEQNKKRLAETDAVRSQIKKARKE